jgi:hypothetical protein
MAKFVRMLVSGGYSNAAISREQWAFNVNLLVTGGSLDDSGTLPSISVVEDFQSGTWTGGTWSQSWHGTVGTAVFTPHSFLTDQAQPAAQALFHALCSSEAVLKRISLYPMDYPVAPKGDLRAQGGNVAHLDYSTPYAGGGDNTVLPLQVAQVLSWQANVLGRKGRGRIYIPAIAAAGGLGAHGLAAPGYITACGAAGVSFIQALTYTSIVGTTAQVAPIITGKPYTNFGRIKEVRVGQVFDTQRRRRRQLPENFVAFPVVG